MVTIDSIRRIVVDSAVAPASLTPATSGDRGIRLGVTTCDPFPEVSDTIGARVADGLHGGLAFTYADPQTAADPRTSFPWGVSIVVAAVPYLLDGDGYRGDEQRSIARFADGDRYDGVRHVVGCIAAHLTEEGFRAETVYDDDRLVDRAVAVRAGIAWNGKSTMALTPGLGPWFLIGSVVTDAPLDPTEPMTRTCGTCTACIPACPTGAIVAPGVLDASRCLAAVLQRPGIIPGELRRAVGPRVYGCDDCLTACPPGDGALASLRVDRPRPSAREVLAMSDEELGALTRHWYVPKRNMRHVRRNALVGLGNRAGTADVGLLAGYLGHPDALLRGHAAWALGILGTEEAHAALRAALAEESDDDVRDEIARAFTTDGSEAVYAGDPDPDR